MTCCMVGILDDGTVVHAADCDSRDACDSYTPCPCGSGECCTCGCVQAKHRPKAEEVEHHG